MEVSFILVVMFYLPTPRDFVEAGDTTTRAAAYSSLTECVTALTRLRPELAQEAARWTLERRSSVPARVSSQCIPDVRQAAAVRRGPGV